MAESQFLSVIRVWASMAWADGVIHDAEAQALRRLMAVGLSVDFTEVPDLVARHGLRSPR